MRHDIIAGTIVGIVLLMCATFATIVVKLVFNDAPKAYEVRQAKNEAQVAQYVTVTQIGYINGYTAMVIEDKAGNKFLTFRDNVIPLKDK